MKKYLNIKSIAMLFIMFGVVALQSCNGNDDNEFDITGDGTNKVFINTLNAGNPNAPQNSFVYTASKTLVSYNLTGGVAKFPVQCKKPAEKDIVVRFELDNSIVYPGFSMLQDGIKITMDKSELTIPKGKTISSDSITLSVHNEDITKLVIPSHYDGIKYLFMCPVARIVSVDGAALTESTDLTMASVVINASFASNLMTGSTTVPSGTLGTTKTGWTATVGGVPVSNNYLFDNTQSTTNYVTIANSTLPSSLEIDMQSVQTGIRGMRIQHSARDNHGASVNVYIKETESEEYKLQGPPLALSRPANSTPWPHSIRFTNAVNARYIKLEFRTAYNNGTNDLRITEFGVYQ